MQKQLKMISTEQIIKQLNEEKEAKKLTLKEIGDKIGKHDIVVGRILNGKNTPQLRTLLSIAGALGFKKIVLKK